MSMSKKRAMDLSLEDRISLPLQLVPVDAKVIAKRDVPNAKGKYFTIVTVETDSGPWQGAKAEFGFFGDERLDWYRPPGLVSRFFRALNRTFNPLTFFSQ